MLALQAAVLMAVFEIEPVSEKTCETIKRWYSPSTKGLMTGQIFRFSRSISMALLPYPACISASPGMNEKRNESPCGCSPSSICAKAERKGSSMKQIQ